MGPMNQCVRMQQHGAEGRHSVYECSRTNGVSIIVGGGSGAVRARCLQVDDSCSSSSLASPDGLFPIGCACVCWGNCKTEREQDDGGQAASL